MASTALQKLTLAASIACVVLGILLTCAGTFSPSWMVVDLREFRAEHLHGLWWDCVREERPLTTFNTAFTEAPIHCMYKFDSSAELVISEMLARSNVNGAAGEAVQHEWWGYQKVVLSLIILSNLLALTSAFTGCCIPRIQPSAFIFIISLFCAMLFSLIADGIFFLAANRVDVRFVTAMVGTYQQYIGYAFYLHLSGTLCWAAAFGLAILTTFTFIASKGQRKLFERSDNKSGYPPRSQMIFRPKKEQVEEPIGGIQSVYVPGGSADFLITQPRFGSSTLV